MRLIKGSLAGLVLAGILAVAPTAAFARGGGGHGGGGGGHAGGGGHFAGGGGHFAGGGGHFAGGGGHFAGDFAGHRSATHEGAHFAAHGWHGGHYGYGGGYWGGGPFWGWYGDPYWYDYPYYGDYDYNDGDYSDAQTSPSEVARSEQTIVAVQKELAKLGYYHGQIDGIVGPETRKAISWFQSVDKLSVSGRIDDPTLKALQIS
jgi:Putative peptidoglycan binding domain